MKAQKHEKENSALEMISFHCVHICFLVAYLWSTPQSIHLFAHFILFHYIACLKDLKIYHFDYNHTTAKESFFFLTEPCRSLFFMSLYEWGKVIEERGDIKWPYLGDTQCTNLVCWHKKNSGGFIDFHCNSKEVLTSQKPFNTSVLG